MSLETFRAARQLQSELLPPPRPRVLVADDQRDVVYLMGHFLEDAGVEVRATTSGREAFGLATRGAP